MLILNVDIVPTLGAAVLPLKGFEDSIKKLLVDGQVGIVSPSMTVVPKAQTLKGALSEDNSELVDFFSHPDVQKKMVPTSTYVDRLTTCQMSDGGYCDRNLKTRRTGEGAIRLCWHHDNLADDSNLAFNIARNNSVRFGLRDVARLLYGDANRPVTIVDLCWWAVRNDVFTLLPEKVLESQFERELNTARRTAVFNSKVSNERYQEPIKETLKRYAGPVIKLAVDDEPPASFMRKPKMLTWHSEKYLKFVRTLPCRQCGCEAGIAHHLIQHGEGKMGGKAHDIFTFALCNQHHQELHRGVDAWEKAHGTQLWHVKETIKLAFGMEALS